MACSASSAAKPWRWPDGGDARATLACRRSASSATMDSPSPERMLLPGPRPPARIAPSQPTLAPVPPSVTTCPASPGNEECGLYSRHLNYLNVAHAQLMTELIVLHGTYPISSDASARALEIAENLARTNELIAWAEQQLAGCFSRALANNDTGTHGSCTAPNMVGD